MLEKMRPLRIAAMGIVAGAFIFLGWKAVGFFPGAFDRFRGRGDQSRAALPIDSSLFEQEATEPDGAATSVHGPLDSLLLARKDSLGIASLRVGRVRPGGRDLPLFSLELRRGVPLAERVIEISEQLSRRGWSLVESDERPLQGPDKDPRRNSQWCWVARISRGEALEGLVRARFSAEPSPGTFALHMALWTRDTVRIPPLSGLAPGSVVALPPRAFSDPSLGARMRAAGVVPALLADLETTRDPVSRQTGRILLQHREREFRSILLPVDSCRTVPRGIVVVDGDRGSADPELAERISAFAQDRNWWIMDATGSSASRLREKAVARGIASAPASRRELPSDAALAAATAQAAEEGEASVVIPLDSSTVRRVAACLPLMRRKGIAVVPWPVSRRGAGSD